MYNSSWTDYTIGFWKEIKWILKRANQGKPWDAKPWTYGISSQGSQVTKDPIAVLSQYTKSHHTGDAIIGISFFVAHSSLADVLPSG